MAVDESLRTKARQLSSDIAYYSNLRVALAMQMADVALMKSYLKNPDSIEFPEDDPATPEINEREAAIANFTTRMEKRFGETFENITLDDIRPKLVEILGNKLGIVEPLLDQARRDKDFIDSLIDQGTST